ncbi:hypothetical protein GCM10009716_31080 [Streptomyces sodiiphilus]|uniref:SAV-6107-like HEPN domain-containing protein n=2 Tax=Streptomyces sodiiphilus TaxID=226217 RepID=A0ABN2PFG1_9ACTN
MTGFPTDVHPVPRRAPAPPAALDLLAQAERGLEEAAAAQDPGDAYVAAHLAALRAAAALLAARGRPEPTPRARKRIRSMWEVLPEIAPELAEWSVLFAASAARRARIEAGIGRSPGRLAESRREADDLCRAAGVFLRLVRTMLSGQPVLPRRAASA